MNVQQRTHFSYLVFFAVAAYIIYDIFSYRHISLSFIDLNFVEACQLEFYQLKSSLIQDSINLCNYLTSWLSLELEIK